MNKYTLGTIAAVALVGLSKNIGSRNDDDEESSEEGVIKFPFKGNPQNLPEMRPVPQKFWEYFPGPHLDEVPSAQQMALMDQKRKADAAEAKAWIEKLRENAKNMQFEVESVSPQDLASGKIIEFPIVSLGDERYTLRELAELAKDPRHQRWFVRNFGRVVLRIMKGYNI
tara:strand:+ start:1788 stop:2297 length:510 start_codon:yes stop_codon:yes gene_type:complete